MANLPSLLENFSSFLQNNQVSFTNGLLILFTISGEQIFRFAAFRCPNKQPEAKIYACSYVFGPAIVLGILGVVVNNLTWHLCHGYCNRSEPRYTCSEKLQHLFAILSRACVVPSAWIFITFLDGNYYVCMMSSTPAAKTEDSEENKRLLTISQIISWAFLVVLVLSVSIVICVTRCLDTVSYVQNRYAVLYREVEAEHFEEKMKKTADEEAKINVETFLSNPLRPKEDWDLISKAPDHRVSNAQPPCYSPLQKWSHGRLPAPPRRTRQLPISSLNVPQRRSEGGAEGGKCPRLPVISGVV